MGDELTFIERLRSTAPPPPRGEVWIGDDAAVLADGSLLATDAVVEGVHFDLSWCSPEDVGWKALVVNLSDIAAMGGEPRAAVVSLVVPRASRGLADRVMAGVVEAAGAFRCPLVGGDTSGGSELVVAVSVLGAVEPGAAVLRSGAREGDAVFVTGELGGAATALDELRRGGSRRGTASGQVARLLRPMPRLPEGRAAAAAGATAMVDISDGLGSDLSHVCDASGVGVRVFGDSVPLAAGSALDVALRGGDDYELCFTAPDPALVAAAFARCALSVPHCIGRIEAGARVLETAGGEGPLSRDGWRHGIA